MREPVIDKVQMEAWLNTQPREVAAVIAARAALRALPLVMLGQAEPVASEVELLALRFFRSAAAILVNYDFGTLVSPKVTFEVKNLESTWWRRGPRIDVIQSFRSLSGISVGRLHKIAAERSLDFSIDAYSWVQDLIRSIDTGEVVGAASGETIAHIAMARDQDFFSVNSGHVNASRNVHGEPLWQIGEMPSDVQNLWLGLRDNLLGSNHDWEVWTDWYEARLEGRPANEPLEIARVTLPEDLWEQGPAAVNARIKELIAEHSAPREQLDLDQRPAPYTFGWQNDRIEAEPMREAPVDPEIAEDILDELREKASAALSGLKGNHADPRLIASVSSFLDCIQGRAAEIREGRLLMRFRALEADAAAFADPASDRERSTRALVADLAASAEDLISLYPKLRAMEANRLAMRFKVDERNYEAFRKAVDELTAIAEASPFVGASAVEALKDGSAEQQHLTTIIEGAGGERAQAEAIEKRSMIAGLQALDVRNFVSPVWKRCGEELNDIGAETWKRFRADLPKTLSGLLNSGVKVAVIGLVVGIGPKVVALGLLIKGFDRLGRWAQEVKDALDDKEDTSADGDDLINT
ncbi:hypothetical protein [Roseibium litorale]|uniref:Uncharacterized protein n=1 Tax=Roseibium litorale TaxID=2803841 RepID=A0ABR9CHR9_9HYPH|nr:hypothetical protein [Roseibium litorale]MBD8890370.1 hypothetical protein [Roseibium litorale]